MNTQAFEPRLIPPGNTDQVINSFEGKYAFLSNFHPAPIRMYDLLFPTAEHCYQWHKLLNAEDRAQVLRLEKPGLVRKFATGRPMLLDWDDMRTGIMLTVLIGKFGQNLDLKLRLIDTSPCILIEGNEWGDGFWGCVWYGTKGWVGANHLGRLLMMVRDNL